MIRIHNLSKSYGKTPALRHLNMEIGRGRIFGLLGPNGAGKTTLLSIVNGLTGFQEGEIEIFGLSLAGNIRQIRSRCAFIPQALAFYDNLTVIENLRFFAGIQSIRGAALQKSLDHAISVNRLQHLLDRRSATLSGGEKRRLNIGIGLLNNPEILYFDEPTIGIDPESRNDILTTIRSFREENKTVIYSSHYMEEIEKICDEVAIIHHGRIIRQDSLQDMLQQGGSRSAIIELYHPDPARLSRITGIMPELQLLDEERLMLPSQDSASIAQVLTLLEEEQISIRQVRYHSRTLESLFINLTSHGEADA